MPPRLPMRSLGVSQSLSRRTTILSRPSVCFFCSLRRPDTARPSRRKALTSRRFESTNASIAPAEATTSGQSDPRKDLEDALEALQKHAANYVNLSRVQLALNGLRQPAGQESIRVAVLGLVNIEGSPSNDTAKRLLNVLLADPLKVPQAWEQDVHGHDLSRPMIIRVGKEESGSAPNGLTASRGSLLHEITVSSPALDGHNLEFLLMESDPYNNEGDELGTDFADSVLVPTVDIPTSNDGRYTPITTPVHKALIVSDGILGAAVLAAAPLSHHGESIHAVVNIPEYKTKSPEDLRELLFTPVDIDMAADGVNRIRKNVAEAMTFERQWFQSNIPLVKEWLVSDVLSTGDGITKKPVRELIASLLRSTSNAISYAESTQLASKITATKVSANLDHELDSWAQGAHSELQEQLDDAFASRRWRKLGWWKLFWRVDDVGHIATDILNQRFLTESERSSIFLAGQLQEAGAPLFPQSSTQAPVGVPERTSTGIPKPPQTTVSPSTAITVEQRWPTSIPDARRYLQSETIPALQALAQKLVFQALSTSGLTTSLGVLVYFGTLSTGIYEAGAVAALGIVWSLQRLQKKWEKARVFWEGEVREEGRKAVKEVEIAFKEAISRDGTVVDVVSERELKEARALVDKATAALEKLK